ncbi:MAG: hypothetical protein NTY70_13545, partial [Burkholderiales bacterium]|nr:hypothetical protein [Burkholderiales bacterium]
MAESVLKTSTVYQGACDYALLIAPTGLLLLWFLTWLLTLLLTWLLNRIRMWRCQLCGAENGSEMKLSERSEFASFPILRLAQLGIPQGQRL